MNKCLEKITYKETFFQDILEIKNYVGLSVAFGGYILQNPNLMMLGMAMYQSD